MGNLHFDATYNNEEVMRKIRESQKAFVELGNSAETQGRRIDAAFEKISLKSLERVQQIMKNFPNEVQGISSFQRQIDGLEKHIERLSQRIASVGNGKLGSTFSDVSGNVNIGNVLKEQVYEGAQAVNTLTEKIIKQKVLIKDIEHDVRTLGEAYKKAGEGTTKKNALFADFKGAKSALQEEKNALFELQTQQAQARLSVRKLKDEQKLYQKETETVVNANEKMSLSFGKLLGVIGGVAALKKLGSEIIRVRGEFQSMQTAIETMVGKDVASQIIPQIKELAKISPLTLTDMVGAEKMMLGFNIQTEDTIKYLKALSDLSMGEAGKFNSLTLAFSQMSAAGKLMGQDLNQMINAGFNPLQTISEKTGKTIAILKDEMSKGAISAEMVQQAFIDATSAGGKFFGMSENASKTINGQLSMMQDAMDNAFNEMGQKSEGIIMSGIQLTTSLIENYETIGKVLVGMIATYGVYKTALITNIALTHSWTVAARADAVAKGIQTIATKAQTVAQLALNAAMKANPYVLAATLIVGAATAMWALHDSTTAAERAQKKYNKTKADSLQKEEEHKSRLENLIATIQNEYTSSMNRVKAIEAIKKEYPSLFQKYIDEKGHIKDLIGLWKEYNEEVTKNKVETNKKNLSDSTARIEEYEKMLSLWKKLGENPYYRKKRLSKEELELAEKYKGETESSLRRKLELAKPSRDLYQEDVRSDKLAQWQLDLKKSTDIQIKTELEEMKRLQQARKNNKRYSLNVGIGSMKGSTTESELANRIAILQSEYDSRSKTTYKVDYEKAKKEWDEAKKALSEIEKDKSKFTSKQYEEAKKREETAEKAYKKLGGLTGSKLTKEETQAEKLRKETEKYKLLLDKQGLERQRQQEDMETQLSQSKIDAMSDGFLKEYSQRELNNKKEIQALQRQKEDYIRAYIQAEKEKFDAEEELKAKRIKGYKKQTFNDSTVKVNTSKYDEVIENTKTKQGIDEWQKREDAMNEYLLKYGTFSQKKEAIDKKYRAAMDKETTFGGKGVIQKEWDEALANLDLSKLKEDINWGMIFGDMSKVTKKQLQQVKKQLQEFKRSPEFKTSTPEQIKVIEEALNNINTALVDKGGFFGGLTDSLTEYEGTVYKVKEAQEELEKALKSGDEVAIEKAKKKKNAAEQNQANAQANVEKSKDKAISNITAVSNAIVQLGKENVSLSDIGNTVGTLVDALSSSGTKIGGIISAILSIIDAAGEVGTFQYGMDIIENISSTVTDAFARDTESITGLDMSFMKSADYDDYNELVEQYDTLIDVWDQLLDKKKAYIKESYGIEATKAGQEALDLLNSERKITRELASSRLDAGASSGSHSMNYRMWKGSYDYNGTNWKDVAGDISKSLGGVDFSSMWSMLDMSSEQLEWIKINYSGLWASMDGGFRGYLDDIIQYGDTEKEILKSINEQLTQTSFDSLFDSFLNTLMDMDASSKDFADSFEEYMRKAIFTSMFAKNYEDELTKWYEAFAEANKKEEGITEDDVKNLRNRWDNIVNGALSDREAWEKIVGSSGSESSREASKKGLATASQDSVDELNGRFTVIQGHTYEINSSVKVIQSDTAKIAEKLSFLTSMDKNMSDMVRGHDIIVAHLSNIEGYTANLVDIRQFMYFMKLGIDSLNTKGITLKR